MGIVPTVVTWCRATLRDGALHMCVCVCPMYYTVVVAVCYVL